MPVQEAEMYADIVRLRTEIALLSPYGTRGLYGHQVRQTWDEVWGLAWKLSDKYRPSDYGEAKEPEEQA